eukprot:1196178-Prorocentrum_minimum.AAC.2
MPVPECGDSAGFLLTLRLVYSGGCGQLSWVFSQAAKLLKTVTIAMEPGERLRLTTAAGMIAIRVSGEQNSSDDNNESGTREAITWTPASLISARPDSCAHRALFDENVMPRGYSTQGDTKARHLNPMCARWFRCRALVSPRVKYPRGITS